MAWHFAEGKPLKSSTQSRRRDLTISSQFVSSYGKWLARAAGAKPGTKASSYIQLYAGYIVSGLLHEIGDRQLDRGGALDDVRGHGA